MRNCAPRETLGIGNFHAPHFQSSIQHANINLLFFADFFFNSATDFAEKEGVLEICT